MDAAAHAAFLAQAQTSLEQLFPATIEIAGIQYDAARGAVNRTGQPAQYGVDPEALVAFRVRAALLAGVTIEPEKTILTFNATEFIISQVTTAPNDSAVYLGCRKL